MAVGPTSSADAPDLGDIDLSSAFVEREPVTIVVSQKG